MLPCPACGHPTTSVIDTRLHQSEKANTIRRIRKCPECWTRFETQERLYFQVRKKLTDRQVVQIRAMWRLPKPERPTQPRIAKMFGISPHMVYLIVNNKFWTKPEINVKQRKPTE